MVNKNRLKLLQNDMVGVVRVGARTENNVDRITFDWENMYTKWKAIDQVVMRWFPSATLISKTFGRNGGHMEYNVNE